MKTINPVREAWMLRFNIPQTIGISRKLNNQFLTQLSQCKSDCARRLILGVSQ